jgi:hypothetical protein
MVCCVAPGKAAHQLTCLRQLTWPACARSFPGMCGQDLGVVFCWNPVKIALAPQERIVCRRRSQLAKASCTALVIHWIHVSFFFSQQNVRRT